jgi:hypothetical protein
MKNKIKHIPLFNMIEHWKNKKSEGDKGGSFNVQLYLAVCQAKQNQNRNGKFI